MSDDQKNHGNILIHPEELSDRMKHLEYIQDADEIALIEEHLRHRLRLGGAITYIDGDGNHVIEDNNGIRPFLDSDEFPSPPPSVELEIRELAFRHGVHGERTELDNWTEAVSANAGDEIVSDPVELLIIGLGRIDAVDGIELTTLHARYLEEVLND